MPEEIKKGPRMLKKQALTIDKNCSSCGIVQEYTAIFCLLNGSKTRNTTSEQNIVNYRYEN